MKELEMMLVEAKAKYEVVRVTLEESNNRISDYRLLGLEVPEKEIAFNDNTRALLAECDEDIQLILAQLQAKSESKSVVFYPENGENPVSEHVAYYREACDNYRLETSLQLKGRGIKQIDDTVYLVTPLAYEKLCSKYVISEKMFND